MRSILRKTLLGVLVAVFGLALTGCNPEQKKQFSINFKEAGPGYVTMVATVPNTTKCAYTISEVEIPSSIMNATYLNMSGEELYIYSDGEIQLCDFDIQENTKYYIYLVAILGSGQFSEVYRWEFETSDFSFSELATVLAVTPDGYKMRITVPESVRTSTYGESGSRAIRYAQSDIMMYNYYSSTEDDYGHLLYNGAKYVTEDTTLEFSDEKNIGPTGIDINEDGVVDENDVGLLWNPIAPGEPVVFVAGEFEWMQEPEGLDKDKNYIVNGFVYPAGWKPGYYLPCIDSTKYWSYYRPENVESQVQTRGINIIEGLKDKHVLDDAWTGAFQRKTFRTRIPAKLDANINVEVDNLKSVNARVIITPDENIYRYLFTILDQGSYDQMMDLLEGHDEYLQWAVTSFFSMYNFATVEMVAGAGETQAPIARVELTNFFYDVPSDTKYHVLVTGMSGDIGSPQCFKHFEFSTLPKTKTKGPTVEVEALTDSTTAFSAAYNIKCTSVATNPVDRCYYGANYSKEWVLSVNSGNTYEALGKTAEFSAAEIEKINSEDGLTVYIPSIDGETTRLVVVAYNDENISNGVDEWKNNIMACPAVADCTTPYAKAADNSWNDLLDRDILVGDWTMTATNVNGEIIKEKVAIKREFIEGEGKDYPSEMPEDVKAIYESETEWEEEEILNHFNTFKELAEVYNTKRLRGQNKLLLLGWFDNDSYGRTATMTPWDMFKSDKISTVDVESMYSDFGPKIHITVAKDVNGKDSLCVVADRMFASPALNWSQSLPYYLAGRANQDTNNTLFYYGVGGYQAPLVFPVELAEDRNTITIKAIETNGLKYYPNLVGIDQKSYGYILDEPIISDVVLTKGWTDEVEDENEEDDAVVKSASVSRSVVVDPSTSVPRAVYKQKTDFKAVPTIVTVEKEVLTIEKLNENLKKFSEKYF